MPTFSICSLDRGASASLSTLLLALLLSAIGAEGADAGQVPSEVDRVGVDLLGDGLNSWRGYRADAVPGGWRLVDGVLSFDPERGGRGDLITRSQYGDFELTLEWRISPGGNSGIFFRVSEDAAATYSTGPEMQVLDNQRHVDGKDPRTSAGANYALHAPAEDATVPVGEYNQARIRVEGARVRHWLNGELIVDYELWSDDWEARVAASKFRVMPGYGRNRTGHIALQDHGDRVWYRRIRLVDLDPATDTAADQTVGDGKSSSSR